MYAVIILQTQLFGDNICQRTPKIIQKILPNFKSSKTVGLGFMARQTCGEVLISEKIYCIFEFQNCYINPVLPVC